MNNIQLTNEITLKLSHPSHAEKLFKAVKKNKKHLSLFLSWFKIMNSHEDFEKYLTQCTNEQNEGKEKTFNIFKNNIIIGRIGLHQIDKTNRNAHIGYWIDKNEQGKGIITKATQLLIDYAFQKLALHRIEILTSTKNIRSSAIPVRLGFQKEGVLREIEKHDNSFYDLEIFSILKKEWKTTEEKSA